MEKKLMILAIVTITSSYVNSCCFPTRLEAIEGISIGQNHNGTTSTVQALYNISYDILSKKAFISGRTTVDGVVYNELLLQDYADGKQYVVVDGKCTVIPFKEIMMSCIPSDATLVMSTYYGFDANRIDIDMYSFIHDGVQITLSVTKEGCVPVAQHMMSNDGITDASFVGITLGIKDISIFNVPTYCQNVAPDTQSQSQGNKSVSSTVIWRVN